MPANLSPDYLSAEREYRDATTHAEKVAALERMLATIPKHKGTEKLQADLRKRLSQARKESHSKGAAHSQPFYLIEKDGAAQVLLAGPPNSGKSRLIASVTRARPAVADYPFTTRVPAPGMMSYENVHIQLVDMPPLDPGFSEPWTPQAVRHADASVLVLDVNDPGVLGQMEYILARLAEWRAPAPVLLAANKLDLPGAEQNYAAIAALHTERMPSIGISAETGLNLDAFRRAVFDALGLVRVYTKPPGRKPELTAPYVLHRGQTVQDAARLVHKDFAEHLKFARLFRQAGHRDGAMVERTHLLEDGDILELHL